MTRAALLCCVLLMSGLSAARAGFYDDGSIFMRGNDTGGIISWSPYAERTARARTAAFCAAYGKYPRITGVRRRYGEYISFNCLWNPNSARFILPRVPVASCHRHRYRHHHYVCY